MNIWFWLFLLLPPLFVFSAKPGDSEQRRAIRLLLALAVAYGCLALAAYFEFYVPDTAGLLPIFIFYFGWLPAFTLVGLYELFWCLFFFRRIQELKQYLCENIFSFLIMAIAVLAAYPTYVLTLMWFGLPF